MLNPVTGTKQARYGTLLALVSIIILLAFWLRLLNLDAFSFWTDEGLTPLRSSYDISEILSNRITIQEGITRDTHPPFYYLIIHFTQQAFGQSDFAYRYPSLLAGVLLVPLLFQFGRRLQTIGAGLFAALFAAVNPLQVYYGNEARMYTIFVFLAAAASYVLWRALSGADIRRSLLLYVVLAGLAFYTHYTAVFLIAAQALFWVWLLWRQGYKRLIVAVSVLALLAAIPAVPFTIPRIFGGVEASYYYVQPLTMLLDVWRFFSLGMTADFGETLVTGLLFASLLLAITGLWSADSWLKRLFLLAYLFSIVLGLMAGSLIKPMYQGVRHIMAGSPAYILLLAIGADYLWQGHTRTGSARAAGRIAGVILVLAVLSGSAYALNNLYNNPAFAKDDFRGMIRYIERRAGDNDVVLYHNAILLPVHEHYRTRQDLDATAAPIYPYDAEGVEAQLEELTGQYSRIWFTSDPPADDRDPQRKVPGWLEENLQDIDNESFHARTTIVHSTGYRSAPNLASVLAPDAQPLDHEWPGLPALRGILVDGEEPAGNDTLWLDLFWQGDVAAPPREATLRLWLAGENGGQWGQYEQGISDNFDNWPAEDLVRESYKLPLPEATPPGRYQLMAQPLDKESRALGDAAELATLTLAPSPRLPGAPAIIFEDGLALKRIDWFDESIHPGHNMSAAFIWQTNGEEPLDLGRLRYEVDIVAPNGDVVRTLGGKPGDAAVEELAGDMALREETAIYFPPESDPGDYELWWRLYDGERAIRGRPAWRPWFSSRVIHGELAVTPWPMITTLPNNAIVTEAQFGPDIQLYGYEIGETSADSLPITLHWLATGQPADSFLVFLHLVDDSGAIISQVDRVPVEDLRPTSGWREGEILSDTILLALPPAVTPGTFRLNVGLYNPDTGQRLPVTVNGERQQNDQLALSTISLP
ncbi:MAG: glycosyltransferase family 39 protein [Candidatus Promineifilaceae bacterium]